MKKILNIVVLLISVFIVFSCSTSDGGDIPHRVLISLYKDGKRNHYNELYKYFTFKVSPEDLIDFTIVHKDSSSLFDFNLPLYMNFWDNKNERWDFKCKEGENCDKNKIRNIINNTEIFNLTVLWKEQELFNRKLKIKYKKDINFLHPEKVYYLDENNKWQIYKDEKVPLLNDKKEPTGYEYSIDFYKY